MNNYKTNSTFDATQAAVEQVYNYYGIDTDDDLDEYQDYRDYSSLYSTPHGSTYDYDYDYASGVGYTVVAFTILFTCLFVGAFAIISAIARWQVFKKAGQDGWEALIPVHSEIVELKLGGIKTYWYFLNLLAFPIPIGPMIIAFWKSIKLAHSFGKGTGFGIGLALLPIIFYPILAWGSAQYIGPQGTKINENVFYSQANNNPVQQNSSTMTSNNPLSSNPSIVTTNNPSIITNNNPISPNPSITTDNNPVVQNRPIINNDLSSYTDPNIISETNNDKTE